MRGRSPATRGASAPDATSTPTAGTASSAPATDAGSSPPARITGISRATAAASVGSARVPVPPGCGPPAVSSRIRAAPAARSARARPRVASTRTVRSAGSSGATAGRCTTAHAGRGEAAIRAGFSPPANWIASTFTATAEGIEERVVGVGGDGDERRGPLAARGAGATGEGGTLGDGQLARRPGHEVEADRVGAGGQRRVEAGVVDDAADLHERDPVGGAGIHRHRAGGHEGRRGGARIAARTSASPTSAAS